jgi:hypothetical protein
MLSFGADGDAARLHPARDAAQAVRLYEPHRTIEGARKEVRRKGMIRGLCMVLVLAGCLAFAQRLAAQTPAGKDTTPADVPKPSSTVPSSGANPFPEDTSTVPVLPSTGTPALPAGTYDGRNADAFGSSVPLPSEDTDPVRSPDDPAPTAPTALDENSSSSLANIDKILPPPDADEPQEKHKKLHVTKEPTHQEAASSDIEVGSYYLDRKNWKAALSRFQSAMVLDPENPEVYWGLAESERNLGQFANAREHYEKLLDYDPDGKHGKEARKALKDPALASAQKPVVSQTPPVPPQ